MGWTRGVRCGLFVFAAVACAVPARAGEIMFSIRDGRVTLVARDAQLADILAVWEREGRTKIVARERVQGMVASLELTDEPERAALATVLRSVSGYVAARYADPPRDGSTYRFIVIDPAPAPTYALLYPGGSQSRPVQPNQPQMGLPTYGMSDGGIYPPGFTPPQMDPNDEVGGRQTIGVGLQRPPFDTTGADPASRPTPPTRLPGATGPGMTVPGAVVPAPPPATAAPAIQRPPGIR
jgi:hypothetical protein